MPSTHLHEQVLLDELALILPYASTAGYVVSEVAVSRSHSFPTPRQTERAYESHWHCLSSGTSLPDPPSPTFQHGSLSSGAREARRRAMNVATMQRCVHTNLRQMKQELEDV